MGATIILANIFQMQDPLELIKNKDNCVYSADDMERYQKYIDSGSPDKNWFQLTVIINKNNPLNYNPYAFSFKIANINTPIHCDNIIGSTLMGAGHKSFLTFKLDEEDLVEAIKTYILSLDEEIRSSFMNQFSFSVRRLLEKCD